MFDIDDTITTEGKLTAPAYKAMWKLRGHGLKVVPVTGRSAGWCDMIAREWPADAVIGENGAFVFWEERGADNRPYLKTFFHPEAKPNTHPVLTAAKERALREVPGLRVAKDQFSRLYDIALDFAEEEPKLGLEIAEKVRTIAMASGANAKVSSIHVNVWMGAYTKVSMARLFLENFWGFPPEAQKECVLFVGDSPNDAPMWEYFRLGCAVANVRKYDGLLETIPAFIASKECGAGFVEIVDELIKKGLRVKRSG
jgi:HAD superfamily hydrolase (TIGR01484 family)